MKAYSCPSCGAELICDESTAATSCPYCGNPTVVPGQFSGELKPDFILPFKLSREDAIKAWRDCNGLHFIQCACKFTDTCTTCTNNETKSKRMEVKNLIREMKKTNPGVEAHIFRSMENVSLDAVIAYKTKGRKIHFLDNYDNPDGGIEE